MPITSLTIRNVASYDAVGVTLSNLKKLNFSLGTMARVSLLLLDAFVICPSP